MDKNESEELNDLIKKRSTFFKSNMRKSGKLKDKQTKKYVMYYIFFKDMPVYVGVSNNFERRRSEHFSEKYRKSQADNGLYAHMLKNNASDYEMWIILESEDSKDIEGYEVSHIAELRLLNFELKNKSAGGDYSKLVNKTIIDNVNEFVSMFTKIESLTVESFDDLFFDIDFLKLHKYIDNLNWDLLRSTVDYPVVNRVESYDDYIRMFPKKEEMTFLEYTECLYTIPRKMSIAMYFDDVQNGNLVADSGKESVIHRFLDLIDELEFSEDQLGIFVAVKLMMGCDYQNDILPMIRDYDSWEYYDLEEYIKGFSDDSECEYWYYKGEINDDKN